MTLPVSGQISMGDVDVELFGTGTTQISLNDSAVRTFFGKSSGPISITDGYGLTNRVSLSYTFTSTSSNLTLNVSGIAGYKTGKSDITIYVNSGIYLYATSTNAAALIISGASSGDTITLVNSGYIIGCGGNGGGFDNNNAYILPTAGGPALDIRFPITIDTSAGYIAGGGGGGGASSPSGGTYYCSGGGGAGGGLGGLLKYITSHPAAGNTTSAGNNGAANTTYENYQGGSGGRIFSGTGGVCPIVSSGLKTYGIGGQTAGSGAAVFVLKGPNASGGGGGWGAAGGYGATFAAGVTSVTGGYGGTTGPGGNGTATGQTPVPVQYGAAGGYGVILNGNSVTWINGSNSRVYGSIA